MNAEAHSSPLRGYTLLCCSALLLVGLGIGLPGTGRAGAVRPGTCSPAWALVPNPLPTAAAHPQAVYALASTDVWVAGDYYADTMRDQPLTLHWNGQTWSQVPIPSLSGAAYLSGIGGVAANDLWTVGYANTVTGSATLVEHWDGTAWSQVPSPNQSVDPNTVDINVLRAVAAVATDDVWAVGYSSDEATTDVIIMHWDGSRWSMWPLALPGGADTLEAISAVSATDIWAVGQIGVSGTQTQPLTVHWDGSHWTPVTAPSPGRLNALHGVTAPAANDVWAVGDSTPSGPNQPDNALTVHWDGSAWTQVPGPVVGTAINYLAAARSFGPAGVLAAGVWRNWFSAWEPLVAQWDGSAWSGANTPPVAGDQNYLTGIDGATDTDVWAAGYHYDAGTQHDQVLLEHYAALCVTPSPTLPPSATPPAPTATATRAATMTPPVPPSMTPGTAPSATPVASPTAPPPSATAPPAPSASASPTPSVTASPVPCAISFTDVQPADYFYVPVQYLACHGVISGYADGTFRPSSRTTRAQQVKIAVLGFGLPIPTPAAGAYTFADVPPAQPFFAVVEAAAARHLVSGYGCGAPDEPCDGQHRPYLRPYADVSRGQIAKIVVTAAGWAVQNPARPTFVDVAPGSPFYAFVETAVCHGVISGYADRTFRPGIPATRGQIAKIVYLSVTQSAGCGAP